jgi:hypothetical protein
MTQSTSSAPPLRDELYQVVPPHLERVFESSELDDLIKQLHRLRDTALLLQWPGLHLRLHDIWEGARMIEAALRDAIPYCVHADCDGRGCVGCRNTGWLPRASRLR